MDPISVTGLVIGIVALYSTSRDCYIFFTQVKSAEKDSLIHLRELDIQQSILKAWGFYWEIQRHDAIASGSSTATAENRKLSQFLERNIYKANGVISALCAISDTLSNRDKLIKRYGLNLKPATGHDIKELEDDMIELALDSGSPSSTIQITANKVRQRLSAINKCRWAIRDRENFKKLVADLKSYNDALYRLCPDGAFEAMNVRLTLECLSQQESFAGLRRTLKLANELLENDGMSPYRGGLQMLASAAKLKAEVVKLRRAGPLPDATEMAGMVNEKQLMDLNDSLALLDGRVVYVERKSYDTKSELGGDLRPADAINPHITDFTGGDNGDISGDDADSKSRKANADLEMRADIIKLCYTLRNVDGWKRFLSLKPSGLVDYTQGRYKYHIGLIYELPGTLGVPSRSVPAKDVKSRKPRPLIRLQSDKAIPAPLGARFELARKVFSAVVFLHASGWLHKNIRSSSIVFFPKQVEDRRIYDLSEPYLARYDFSRPDDVRIDEQEIKKFEERSDGGGINDMMFTRRVRHIKLDYYHHPDKRASPERMYRHAYDVYSLGIVLLEIGLWEQIDRFTYDRHVLDGPGFDRPFDINFSDDPYEFRRNVVTYCLGRLRFMCGDVYANVVHKCLMTDASDSEIGKVSQRDLCARIAADLSECRA